MAIDLIILSELSALLPSILLYAEIHYTLRGFYNRLTQKEPEVIADVPHRLEPGMDVPVLLIIKDAHRYPVSLDRVDIELRWSGQARRNSYDFKLMHIGDSFWHQIFNIPAPAGYFGPLEIDVTVRIESERGAKTIRNDNYRRTSHAPFAVTLDASPLPAAPGWRFGEFHCHTSYTNDQVEFGAPLGATRKLAQAMGLSFFCATDHSYDLDDDPDNYLKKDPALGKWKALWNEIAALNARDDHFVIIPGEEISAGNHRNQNVHILLLNNPEYVPGDGDGAERWLRTRPTISIGDILLNCNKSSLAFAAHPAIQPPWLQRLFVRRGKWQKQDYVHPRLQGLQIWNGSPEGLDEGLQAWVELLLSGRRIFIVGGNDAHGNFNRFRQIGVPFLSMRENHHNLFGKVRTALYVPGALDLESLLSAIRLGNMVVTDGPFVELQISDDAGKLARPGDNFIGAAIRVHAKCFSSREFGALAKLVIIEGDITAKTERPLREITAFPDSTNHDEIFTLGQKTNCYLRAELYSGTGGQQFRCYTNPVWLNVASWPIRTT